MRKKRVYLLIILAFLLISIISLYVIYTSPHLKFEYPVLSDIFYQYDLYRIGFQLRRHPRSGKLHYELAKSHLFMGKIEEYLRELQLARKYDPESYIYPSMLGIHYMNIKDYDKAIELLEEAAYLDKEDKTPIHSDLGSAYESKKEKKKALEEYRLALKYYPNYVNMLNQMGTPEIRAEGYKQYVLERIKVLEEELGLQQDEQSPNMTNE